MNNIKKLSKKIRLTILETIYRAKTGHIGGSFSCIDILIVLFFKKIIFFNPIKLNIVSLSTQTLKVLMLIHLKMVKKIIYKIDC